LESTSKKYFLFLTLTGEKELPIYMLHYTTRQTTDDRLTDIQTDIVWTRKRLLSALGRYFVIAFDSSCYLIVQHLAGCKMQRSAIKLPKILMILVRPLQSFQSFITYLDKALSIFHTSCVLCCYTLLHAINRT